MKKITLLFLGCMVSLLLHAQAAYDFMETNSDGIRIYYKIIDAANRYVEVTNGDGGLINPPTVDPYSQQLIALNLETFRVPATVKHAGITYQVKAIGKMGLFNIANGSNIVDVELPEGLTTIKEEAFAMAYTLRKVNFPSTLTSIGQRAFNAAGAWGMNQTPPFYQTYDLSQTKVTELDNVFGLQFSVEKMIYPETLKTIKGEIGYNAADKFISITIPAAVETIGYFEGPNLNTIYMKPATPPTPADGYLNINSTAIIYVTADATQPYEAASQWSDYAGQYREQVPVGTAGYTTYYLENENFKVPAGCTAYIITGVTPSGSITTPDQAVVKAFTAGKIIPKKTGFILQGTPNTTVEYQANVTGTEENVTGNLLVGTATEQEISGAGYKYYIFSASGDQGLGFYKQGTRAGASIKLKPHRAGLRLPAAIARAKRFIIDFDAALEEAKVTGIRGIRPAGQPKDNAIYDLQGRRVTRPTRGIYIVNGKKVIINQ